MGGNVNIIKQSRNNPAFFLRNVLGVDFITPQQLSLCESIRDNRRTAAPAGNGLGKCVIISDMITLSDGTRIEASELIGKEFELLTIVGNEIKSVPAFAEFNGIEECFEITTLSGKRVTRNAAHPFYIAKGDFNAGKQPKINVKGFTPLKEICVGDLIAVADELPAYSETAILTDAEIKLLGYLIGDGGYTRSQITFSQSDNKQLKEFKELANELDCDVRYLGQYDYTVTSKGKSFVGCNRIRELLRENNLLGKHSRDKRIPDAVFQLPKDKLCMFLSRLFSTDGWASVGRKNQRKHTITQNCEIGFCSASQELVEDVQYLLQKLGIHSKVTKKSKVNAWNLGVHGSSQLVRFAEIVGIYGKEKSVQSILEISKPFVENRDKAVRLRPDRPRWQYKNAHPQTRWEKVTAIKSVGEQPTVAISVPEHHTFLTSFYEHNTWLAARIVLWFLYSYPHSKVLTTAPTWHQVEHLLWREIRKAHQQSVYPLGGDVLQTQINLSEDWFALGLSTNDAIRFQGIHAPRVLVVFDEAMGVANEIWEAAEGVAVGDNDRFLAIGNPTDPTGRFKQVCDSPLWNVIRLSGEEHPNVLEDADIVPGAVTRAWIKEKEIEYGGRDSAFYRARVLGLFPEQGDDMLISLADVERAQMRWNAPQGTPDALGVDVARYGSDETVEIELYGSTVAMPRAFHGQNTMQTAGAIKASSAIKKGVDDAGLGGGVTDRLREQKVEILAYNAGASAYDKEQFLNRRAESWWLIRELLRKDELDLPPDNKLAADLTNIKFNYTSRGQIKLESKDEIKKRTGRSPDRGDALAIALAAANQPVHSIDENARKVLGLLK